MAKTPFEQVLECPSLPTLPAVAVELLELTSNSSVGMSEVTRVVQKDPALSAKVIKTINSSFYGLAKPCGSISRALAYLGMNTVKSLVLGFSLVDSLGDIGDSFDLESHWQRAIYGATSARIFGELIPGMDADEAFTGALFQDIGAIASFVALKERYAKAVEGLPHDAHAKAEREVFGFDHAKVGAALTEKWKLPESIVECVRWHHDPERAVQHQDLVKLVALGVLCADAMGRDSSPQKASAVTNMARNWFGIKSDVVAEKLEQIVESSRTLAKMFGQEVGGRPDIGTIMSQAQNQSLEHQLQVQREAELMAQQAYTDGLTGAHNRKKFDEELARVFDAHKSTGEGLGLLFLDADKFKSVNDTHGHAAGDAVLVELAKRTADAVGDRGLVCRYGGEEFAVLLPGCGKDQAEAIGEDVRAAIEREVFDVRAVECGVDELAVTVSVGVSAADCADAERLTDCNRLVQEADKAVYAAKESGRNAVRVWGHLRNADELQDAVEEAPAVAAGGAPTPVGGHESQGVRVLLVEDDELAAVLVRTVLCQRRGVSVEWIRTFGEFAERIAGVQAGAVEAYDVVVTDHRIHGGTGLAPVQLIKGTEACAGVPVFILSGASEDGLREQYAAAGAHAFIAKDEFVRDMKTWVSKIVEAGAARGAGPNAAAA